MGHVHVDDGCEDGEYRAICENGAKRNVRGVIPCALDSFVSGTAFKGGEVSELIWFLLCHRWCLRSTHSRKVGSKNADCSWSNFSWDAHLYLSGLFGLSGFKFN